MRFFALDEFFEEFISVSEAAENLGIYPIFTP
jgi:hypothetical protein